MKSFRSTIRTRAWGGPVVLVLVAVACSARGVAPDDQGLRDVDGATADAVEAGLDATSDGRSTPEPDATLPLPDADAAAPDTSHPDGDAVAEAATCNAVLFFGPMSLPQCDACLTRECCAITQACLHEQDCSALTDCVYACNDPDGGDCGCAAMHPTSVTKLNDWTKCMTKQCVGYCT